MGQRAMMGTEKMAYLLERSGEPRPGGWAGAASENGGGNLTVIGRGGIPGVPAVMRGTPTLCWAQPPTSRNTVALELGKDQVPPGSTRV